MSSFVDQFIMAVESSKQDPREMEGLLLVLWGKMFATNAAPLFSKDKVKNTEAFIEGFLGELKPKLVEYLDEAIKEGKSKRH